MPNGRRAGCGFSANDADAVVKLYASDAILLGTVSPILSEGTEPIRAYFARLPGSGTKLALGERRLVASATAPCSAPGSSDDEGFVSGVLNHRASTRSSCFVTTTRWDGPAHLIALPTCQTSSSNPTSVTA